MIMLVVLAVAVGVGVLLVYAATRPDTLHVERSTTVRAPADRIYPLIADFHEWARWSRYEKLDAAMQKTYGGAPSGTGAIYAWKGNSKAGEGRMEIIDAARPARVTIKLDFVKPFEGHNIATFTLVPDHGATTVTWAMDGPRNFMLKVMSLFIDMDNMLGRDFANGLASMKEIAERSSADVPA